MDYKLQKVLWFAFMTGISVLITSCSLFSPVKTATNTYRIDAIPYVGVKTTYSKKTILVTRTPPSNIYNTNHMVYSLYPHHVAYFAKNAWADLPDKMLLTSLTLTLQDTHYFKNVSANAIGQYDYVLNTQLIELQQNFSCGTSWISLIYRVQILNSRNKIIATKLFKIIEPVTCKTPYGGVLAANQAASRLLRQVALFTIRKAK